MKRIPNGVEYALSTPLFVVPEHRGVGWQVFGQVLQIAAVLELIEDAIQDFSLRPVGRSCFLILGQKWLNDFPL